MSERRKGKASARAQSSDVVAAAPFRRYLKGSYALDQLLIDSQIDCAARQRAPLPKLLISVD